MAGEKITYIDATLIQLAAAVILIPFISGMFLLFLRAVELKKESKYSEKVTGAIGSGSLTLSWLISIGIAIRYFSEYVSLEGEGFKIHKIQGDYEFLPAKDAPLKWGILLDPLSIIFLVVLTTIATIIHWYATEYMHADPAYTRFFGTLNFFTGSMIGFVLASNLFMGFVFWELLGFSSYLLIGFYWQVRSASAAGKKAFMYNKVGDVSFLIGIALVWRESFAINPLGTLDYAELKAAVKAGTLGFEDLILPGLLIFGGAVGKSAQFPLFGWLPEAMEGPTPVSALLHSSTMVKAGLLLVARTFFMFYPTELVEEAGHEYEIIFDSDLSTYAINTVLWLGVLTALGGALIALTATDIKKVLAFSTISQLGYIGMALGSGGLAPGLFHIVSHATFKSLLFLGAGAVIHSVHSQEMSDMGGLKKYMPWTYWTMAIGLLGLSGFPLMSGFWSKDAVLLGVVKNEYIFAGELAYGIGIFTAIITAFYSTKLFILTFHGEPKYDKDHVHPSPTSIRMRFALVALASLVVIESIWWSIGTIFIPKTVGWDFEYTLGVALELEGPAFSFTEIYPWIAISAVAIGMAFAYFVYSGPTKEIADTIGSSIIGTVTRKRFGLDLAIYWIAENPVMAVGDLFQYIDKEYIDGIVIDIFAAEGAMKVAEISDYIDQEIVDGAVRFTEHRTRDLGFFARRLQRGQTSFYARLMTAGLALILLAFSYQNFF